MSKPTIKPVGDKILVRIHEAEEVKGGIIIPQRAQEQSQDATVVALGSGRTENGVTIAFSVKVGDKVLLSKHGGTDFKMNGVTHCMVRESDILAVLS